MPQTPAAPAAPAAPATPAPVVYHVLPDGTPTTREDYLALQHKRSELSEQLQSAASRRKSLAAELRTADPGSRPGIEARLKVLDDRIVRLEQEMDRTGDQLANVPGSVIASQMRPELANVSKDFVPIVAILSVFVLGPFAVALSRLIWKRGSAPPRPVTDTATQHRLEQLQQSVDTIAVEVERISEAQRFVTRILNERDRPMLGVGAVPAEPVSAAKQAAKQGVRSER